MIYASVNCIPGPWVPGALPGTRRDIAGKLVQECVPAGRENVIVYGGESKIELGPGKSATKMAGTSAGICKCSKWAGNLGHNSLNVVGDLVK